MNRSPSAELVGRKREAVQPGLPEHDRGVELPGALENGNPLTPAQLDAVDVVRVVPGVERRSGHKRAAGGICPRKECTAAATSSRPLPVSSSRPTVQASQPSAGVASSAARSRIAAIWSARRSGRSAKRSAAAAETCGEEYDVPSAWRYSLVPQLEYPCSGQAGNGLVSARGKSESMSWPGAARSTKISSRLEKAGTSPERP